MSIMTREEGRQYKARWETLHAMERSELRAMSPEAKLQQTAALMRSIDTMGWREALEREDWAGHERWNALRERYRK